MALLSADDVASIRDAVAPSLGDDLVQIVEVWRKPAEAEGVVPGGAGVDEYGDRVDEGTDNSRPDQQFAKIAQYPARITHGGVGMEQQYGGQFVAVAPWTVTFNWADEPDIQASDKLLVRVDDWAPGVAIAIGDVRQPTASNGRFYRATVAGTTGGSEPTWPLTPQGATVADGGVTWEYVDKLRTFEVKDAGGEATFNIVRLVRCEEVKP